MGVSMGHTITATIESRVPLPVDKYGDVLKIVQIGFYTIAAIVAILTYLAARRGLLNTVNTEYQKRVMDRLHKLSEDLYSEFDPSSETYWPKVRAVHEAIEHINDVFERNRDEILAERKYYYGAPVTKDVERLRRLLDPAISDPFIPDEIRSAVVDLLDDRIQVLQSLYVDEFEKYSNNLAKGKHGPFTELDDVNKIHNRIVEQQRLRGCGIAQIEEEVHEIRGLIQDYFDSFNPHRRWWQGKRARPGKKRKAASDS
jgi:tetrahydromethanopterin S-methyltransferase subunit B